MTKLSYTTMATPEQDAYAAIDLAQVNGFQGIDFRVHDHKGEIELDSTDTFIESIKAECANHGINPTSLFCYNETGGEDPASWDAMHQSLVRHLDIAQVMGAEAIRIFGGPIHEAKETHDYIKRSAEAIAKALDGHDSSIDIVMQNHRGSYNFLQGCDLVDAVGSDRFGMAFSPDHCILQQEDMEQVWAKAPTYSKRLYIADMQVNSPDDHAPILPGEGNIPLLKAFEVLGGAEFSGWVTFKWEKIWHDELQDPQFALPHFMSWWKANT